MEHVLPIKPDPNFQTSCWDANWLSLVLSDDKYLPWYIEHFISIHMRNNYIVHYYDVYGIDYCSIYDEVLEIVPLEAFYKDIDDVVSFTKKNIDNGYYVNFTLDLFYIDFSNDYNNNHNFHGPLVFGYNDEKKVFYGYDLLFGISEYKFDQYKSACESLFANIRDTLANDLNKEHENYNFNKKDFFTYHIGLHCKGFIACLKNGNFRKKPSLGRILLAIEDCLEGNIFINEKNSILNKWYGVSMYNKFNNDILNNWNQIKENFSIEQLRTVYFGFKTIVEDKKGLKYRMDYLYNNGIIPADYDLQNRFDFFYKRLNQAFLLLVKFNETQNAKYLDQTKIIMQNIVDLDREVLERSSDAIFGVIKHDYNS